MSSPAKNSLDSLLLSLGSPGRLQVILFVLLCTNAYPITFNFIFITFFANVPPYTCKVNGTGFDDAWIPKDKDGKFEKCLRYVDPNNHSIPAEACNDGFFFNLEGLENTIASEWDLTCQKESLATLASTIFFAGVMIGGLIFGTIADKFGRQPVVLFTLYGQAILGLCTYFVDHYVLFVIIKFCQGMLLQGLQASNNSLVMELFPLRYRTLAGMILSMCATSAHMVMSLMIYLLPDWRNMQLTISLLTTVSITYTWLYPESLRWMISQHRHNKALNLIKRIASVNRVTLPNDIDKRLQDISYEITIKDQAMKNYDFRDLFRTKKMRFYTIFLIFSWFSVSLTYYGIQFYIPKMKGKQLRYLNLFISGAMETTARVVGYFIIDRLGRRKPLMVFYIMSGLLCIATGIIADTLEMDVVANVLAIIGKLCSAQCFAFIMVYSSEIFPTVVRTVGLGFVACFTRIGTMLAPQILDLKKFASLSLPFVIFGSVSIISAILLFFMPETLGKPLPNVLEDVEVFQTALSPDNQNKAANSNSNTNGLPLNSKGKYADNDKEKNEILPMKENSKEEHKTVTDDTIQSNDGVVNETYSEENEQYDQRL